MGSWKDYENDYEVGFVISHADDMEEIGWRGVVKKIRETVGENPVYSASNNNRSRMPRLTVSLQSHLTLMRLTLDLHLRTSFIVSL